MIYIIDNENGSKQKIVVPDNAHLMTAEDEAYFQAKANEATANRNKAIQIVNLTNEINSLLGQISTLKSKLNKTDYQAIKYAEGFITETDYAAIKAQRQEWREEINALEMKISNKETEIVTLKI